MSATYNELLLSDLDQVRSLLGDTVVEPAEEALHSDEHIAAVLAQQPTLRLGVGYLAHELVVRFAQEPVKVSLSGVAVDYSERLATWRLLAAPYLSSLTAAPPQARRRPATSGRLPTKATW